MPCHATPCRQTNNRRGGVHGAPIFERLEKPRRNDGHRCTTNRWPKRLAARSRNADRAARGDYRGRAAEVAKIRRRATDIHGRNRTAEAQRRGVYMLRANSEFSASQCLGGSVSATSEKPCSMGKICGICRAEAIAIRTSRGGPHSARPGATKWGRGLSTQGVPWGEAKKHPDAQQRGSFAAAVGAAPKGNSQHNHLVDGRASDGAFFSPPARFRGKR